MKMKKSCLFFLLAALLMGLFVVPQPALAQAPNDWTWMGGSSTAPYLSGCDFGGCSQIGIYGTLGTPAAGNIPGGRNGAGSWTDSSGNLWLFGGQSFDPNADWLYFNDLWEFNPATYEWTWMGGSIPAGNSGSYEFCGQPGANNPTYCGQPGVYGTLGTPAAGNIPGARNYPVIWTDSSGHIWLFGGQGMDASDDFGDLNDLWEFNPQTNEWAWMGGSSTIDSNSVQPGVYGTLGTPAAGNIPSGRSGGSGWVDSSGNFWLFGGFGFNGNANVGPLNDLWEFNPQTNEWAWMGGSNTAGSNYCDPYGNCGQPGVYGTLGTPAAGNIPGSRYSAVSWTDSSGNLWLFGGYGFDVNGNDSYLNDLWEFNPHTNVWTWMGGSSTGNQPGVYGTSGTPAAGNVPGARVFATTWTDSSGHIWLFGGYGIDANGNFGELNDLWEFNLQTNEWTWTGGNNTGNEPGVYGALGTPAAGNVPGGRDSVTGWTDKNGNLWLFGGEGYDAAGNFGQLNDQWEYQLSAILPAATPAINPGSGSYTSIQSVTVSDPTPGATIFYTTDGTTPTTNSTVYSGPLTVSASETLEAIATASGYSTSAAATAAYTIVLPTASPTFSVPGGAYLAAVSVTIGDATPGAIIYYTTNGSTPTTSSMVYSGSINVSSTEALAAIAIAPGDSASGATTAAYTITSPAPGVVGDWTWMGGSSTVPFVSDSGCSSGGCGQIGIYGTFGTAAAGNIPGGRNGAARWTDSSGNLWLFGGQSYDPNNNYLYFNDLWEFNPATYEWTWVGGSIPAGNSGSYESCGQQELSFDSCGQPGVYGTLGTPAAGNIPGARNYPVTWTDSSGHIWLFGGEGMDANGNFGDLNDLWEFNPQTNLWAWMGGSSTVGSTYSQPGVYGTLGTPAAGNIPSGRGGASGWTDSSGNFWLFGGFGFDANDNNVPLNDLWEFNPQTNEWAWMGGSSAGGSGNAQPGVYGTLGTPAAGNFPGGRFSAVSWTDSSGNFWLFGGAGFDVNDNERFLNDLWEFNPQTNEWAWMGGSNTGNQPGVYGTLGTPAAGNVPGARFYSVTWTDNSGHIWLFGGFGIDASGNLSELNDLWEFNLQTNVWTWLGGSSIGNQPGVYGTLGTPATGNVPGGRDSVSGWVDNNGNLWLFGGEGYDSIDVYGQLNDLWEYQLATVLLPQAITFTQPPPVTYGDSPIELSASGGGSGNPVTFTVLSGPGTISGNVLTITGAGTVQVAANQAGNATYAPAPQVTQSITVNKAMLTVAANSISVPYGTSPVLTASITGFVNGDTLSVVSGAPTLATTATSASLPGTYPISVGLGTLSAANYSFNLAGGTVTVTFTASVPAKDTLCNGAYNGTFSGNLTVSADQTCIFVGGGVSGNVQLSSGILNVIQSTVSGNIQQSSGTLNVIQSTVDGNLQVTGGGTFTITSGSVIKGNLQITNIPAGSATNQVCGSTINGNLEFQNNGTAVLIGAAAPASCPGNTIDGNMTIQSNTAPASAVGNTVKGNVTVESNKASTAVDDNTVSGNLQDESNTAATQVFTNVIGGNLQCQSDTTISGGGNTAKLKQGQCSTY